ncbi:MAG: hypothetical protein Kow00122_12020 [Thermoleophilia bacterium]
MGDEVPVTVAGVYERAQKPWMRSGKRAMFLTLEDAYGLYECLRFESKLPNIAPVVALSTAASCSTAQARISEYVASRAPMSDQCFASCPEIRSQSAHAGARLTSTTTLMW